MRGKSWFGQRYNDLMAGFNEARALCAGSHPRTACWPGAVSCFNEARALCAGSRLLNRLFMAGLAASMRPAHYAREVRTKRLEKLATQHELQ